MSRLRFVAYAAVVPFAATIRFSISSLARFGFSVWRSISAAPSKTGRVSIDWKERAPSS